MTGAADIKLNWLLTGTSFGLDGLSEMFLFFTSFLWVVAGAYGYSYMKGDPSRRRFFLFYLISMCGNLGLVFSQDMVGFYLFFTIMTFAAYGLIVHNQTDPAFYAGKVYIVMALIGETLVVSAMILIASEAEGTGFRYVQAAVSGSQNRDIIIALVTVGFGIKAGAIPLHMWLPLAHPVAPTPASAVLSAVIIKAGLLGWLRFLPLGEIVLPGWGALFIAAGLAAAFLGVFAGLAQDDPKTLLAYSSISQMGIMTAGLGIGLSVPDSSDNVIAAIMIYSLHHALNKGALFLGVGVAHAGGNRRLAAIGLLLPSLALAGAPFTSGAAAKTALKSVMITPQAPLWAWMPWLLALTSIATTALMCRFLFLVLIREEGRNSSVKAMGLWPSWIFLLLCSAAAGLFLHFGRPAGEAFSIRHIISALWPVLTGILFIWIAWIAHKRSAVRLKFMVPPGDILDLIVPALNAVNKYRGLYVPSDFKMDKGIFSMKELGLSGIKFISAAIDRTEGNMGRWFVAGILFISLAVILFALMSRMTSV